MAWTQDTRVYGPEDRDVPLPAATPVAGASDQAALELLKSYLQAAGFNRWQGIAATGSITYAGNLAPPPGSATLTVALEGFTRLDVTSSLGNTSLRMERLHGGFQDVTGKLHVLPIRNARLNLFVYPSLMSPTLSDQQSLRITSPGPFQLEGKTFDKLSLTRPVIPRLTTSRAHPEYMTTDVYLSPQTHLPYKSVDLAEPPEPSLQKYLRVITYEDYRQVEGVMLPFRYTETINGERAWVLQLTAAQPQSQSDPAYFTF